MLVIRKTIAGHFRLTASTLEEMAMIKPLMNMESITLDCSEDNVKNKNHEMNPNIVQSIKCCLATRNKIANAVVPIPAIILRINIEVKELVSKLEV